MDFKYAIVISIAGYGLLEADIWEDIGFTIIYEDTVKPAFLLQSFL
jgi:hypothetical protein